MNDIVLTELQSIQSEYLDLLKRIKPRIDTAWVSVIDEVNMFWLQKKKFIVFAMENYFTPYNTFLFTGATYLDYDENEHFPFAVCNGICIVDDNVCTYANIIGKVLDENFNRTIKQQLLYAIDDNIKVLENCSDYIYILPIRYFDDDEDDTIAKGAEGVFLNLFKEKFASIKDYFANIKSMDDLKKSLKPGIEKSLMFFKDDDRGLALSDRIDNYIEDSNDSIDFNGKSIGIIFFSAVYSPIAQALHIMMLCAKYRVIPYLRYNVAFHNFCHLIGNFPDSTMRKIIEDKTYACYLIYKAFDLNSVTPDMFSKFVCFVRENKIYEKVYEKISNRSENISVQEIGDFAHEQLSNIILSIK